MNTSFYKNTKLCCFILVFSFGCSALADAIVEKKYPVKRDSAIQSSSILYSNSDSRYEPDSFESAIKEIKSKIKQNPDDYVLYISLVDLYLKSGQYNKADYELGFLNSLSMQNKLNAAVKSYTANILDNYKKKAKYDRNKSDLYICLALLSLIINDNEQAENYMVYAADSPVVNMDMLQSAVPAVFDTTRNTSKAIQVCEKIIAKNPNAINIRKLKASFYMQEKNNDSAIKEFQKILYIKPVDEDSKYYLYRLLSAKKLSEKDLLKQIYNTYKPDDLEIIYYELADILLNHNEVSDAKIFADTLVNKFPNSPNGYIILSHIYQKEGKLKESYEALAKVRDKADSNESVAKYNVMLAKLSDEPVKEANSLIANGLYQQALDVLDSADQEDLYIILTQARAEYLLKNKQKTLELLNKSMSLYPENSDVYCAFGYIFLKEKDIDSARKYVNRSLKINPQNKTASDLLDMVNKAESDKFMNDIASTFESQNYSETMRLIDEAMSVNAKDSALYYYKALTYIAQNNYAASTACLYKSIELDKNNTPAYFYLGIAFDNLSEPKNAYMYYQKYIDMLPADDFGESERLNYAKSRIQKLKS